MSLFAAMLKGELRMPPPPPGVAQEISADRHDAKSWGNGLKADKMKAYQEKRLAVTRENRVWILRAIGVGYRTLQDIATAANLSKACAFELLTSCGTRVMS